MGNIGRGSAMLCPTPRRHTQLRLRLALRFFVGDGVGFRKLAFLLSIMYYYCYYYFSCCRCGGLKQTESCTLGQLWGRQLATGGGERKRARARCKVAASHLSTQPHPAFVRESVGLALPHVKTAPTATDSNSDID